MQDIQSGELIIELLALMPNQQNWNILKVCCKPRRKRAITTEATTEATTTTTTTTTPKPTKKPCNSNFSKPVASVNGLSLYTDEPKEFDEDCIIEHDAEHFSKKPHPEISVVENNPCKKSVVNVVIPYSFGNCTVNDYQPQCGRHNEVKSEEAFHFLINSWFSRMASI